MNIDYTLAEKINKATLRIRHAYDIAKSHSNTLICAYSGGKDSDVLLDLCKKSGVEFDVQHNHTTVDAPETVYHIREVFEKLRGGGIKTQINKPKMTMWELIPIKRMPPLRTKRYCCEYLKEQTFENQHILTGVRWDESNSRKTRGLHETLHKVKDKRIIYMDENDEAQKLTNVCQMKNRIATNPIIDWTDGEIWEYIRENDIQTNPLYERGYTRVGCIGCPMADKKRYKEFADYPKHYKMYLRAFDQMIKKRKQDGLKMHYFHTDAETVMKWWLHEDINQITMWD